MESISLRGKTVIVEKKEDYKRIKKKKIGKKEQMILYSDIRLGSEIKRKRFSNRTGEEIRPIITTSIVEEITPAESDNCWMVKTKGSLYKVQLTTM